MSRIQLVLVMACLVTVSVGCRGRYNNGLFATNDRVAPPPTYSLNIPSVAKNQPYYNPGGNASGATGAGWQKPVSNAGTPAANNGNPTSPPTNFVETTPPSAPPTRTASAANQPRPGFAYSSSTNYQTTRVDERLDSTRLPVNDATNIQSPPPSYPTTGNNLARLQRPPTAAPGYSGQVGYGSGNPQQTYVAQQNGYGQPVNPFYNGTAVLFSGQPQGPVARQAQNVYTNPSGYVVGAPPTVTATSTATLNSNGGQTGWRDRELNSERF